MNEVKTPKRPLIYYYSIVMLVLLLMNLFITPLLRQARIKEVDYGTFMSMTENGEIGEVEIEDNRILFTDKEGKTVYQTGLMTTRAEPTGCMPRAQSSPAKSCRRCPPCSPSCSPGFCRLSSSWRSGSSWRKS